MPFRIACTQHAASEVVSDHSSHGIRSNGTPNKNTRSMTPHFRKSPIEVASSSTSCHQSYIRHTMSNPYTANVYIRWLGASTRWTGMTGELDEGAAGEPSGRFGRGDRTLEPSCVVFGFCWALPGVEGYDDRMRGVPFMACSPRSLGTLCALCSATERGRRWIRSSALFDLGLYG
jgi:hypothetical protein